MRFRPVLRFELARLDGSDLDRDTFRRPCWPAEAFDAVRAFRFALRLVAPTVRLPARLAMSVVRVVPRFVARVTERAVRFDARVAALAV